jgi:hypothetical protein
VKKLFEVTIEKTIYVLADDEREAELEANTFESEEDGSVLACNEIRDPARVPNEWMDSIPYGENPDDLTIKQILEQPLPPAPYVDPPEQLRIDFQGGAQPA